MKITTNNVPRDIINGDELTEAERKEFDYIDWTGDVYDKEFFRYKGNIYDLGDCEGTSILAGRHSLSDWSGFYSETFFSGVVFRYVNDFEQVVVGRYYA